VKTSKEKFTEHRCGGRAKESNASKIMLSLQTDKIVYSGHNTIISCMWHLMCWQDITFGDIRVENLNLEFQREPRNVSV
jgi:hypothetical protein